MALITMTGKVKYDFLQIYKYNVQGGAKRLPNYHLIGENCVLVGENRFGLPDLVGEKICLLQIM